VPIDPFMPEVNAPQLAHLCTSETTRTNAPAYRSGIPLAYVGDVRITQVKIVQIDGPNLLGYAEITIDDCFCVRDLIIFRKPKGYRVAMPRVKLQSGRYKEIVSALDAKTRKMIEDAVIAEYEKVAGKRTR
jgi:stage V sporulation protein G